MRSQKLVVGVLLSLAASAIAGCAAVDQYSGRAVSYNLEAEAALEQGLLLNVVRAVHARPMQFTSVQSISGTASASSTTSLTAPVGPHSNLTPKTAVFSGTVSGGPTFTVPVLDTQEFYQGVMSPVSSQLIDFYIHEEFPREEIFTLFIEKIVMTRDEDECRPPPPPEPPAPEPPASSQTKKPPEPEAKKPSHKEHTLYCERVFVNYPGSDLAFNLFQALIEHFINLGLTTEPVANAKNSAAQSASNCSNSTPQGTGGPGGSAAPGGSSNQPCQAPPKEYRFCFAPKYFNITDASHRLATSQDISDAKASCASSANDRHAPKNQPMAATTMTRTERKGANIVDTTTWAAASSAAGQIGKKTTVAGIKLSKAFVERLARIAERTREIHHSISDVEYEEFCRYLKKFENSTIFFTVYTRSTEGIVYFLGEVARRQLVPGEAGQRVLQIKFERSFVRDFPEWPCENEESSDRFKCQNLFVLETGPLIDAADLSVSYGGQQYAVPSNRERAGDTMHTLSIVKQLLAINTSAKSLPQTNIISVVSP